MDSEKKQLEQIAQISQLATHVPVMGEIVAELRKCGHDKYADKIAREFAMTQTGAFQYHIPEKHTELPKGAKIVIRFVPTSNPYEKPQDLLLPSNAIMESLEEEINTFLQFGVAYWQSFPTESKKNREMLLKVNDLLGLSAGPLKQVPNNLMALQIGELPRWIRVDYYYVDGDGKPFKLEQ